MGMETCIYCGAQDGDGYCVDSPDGSHCMSYDEDAVDPYECCIECGLELDYAELNGSLEHVCDPDRVLAFKTWQERATVDDDCPNWEYRG